MKQSTVLLLLICFTCACTKETMTGPGRQSAPTIEAGGVGAGGAPQRDPAPGGLAPVKPAPALTIAR